jgi:hypothetical protein
VTPTLYPSQRSANPPKPFLNRQRGQPRLGFRETNRESEEKPGEETRNLAPRLATAGPEPRALVGVRLTGPLAPDAFRSKGPRRRARTAVRAPPTVAALGGLERGVRASLVLSCRSLELGEQQVEDAEELEGRIVVRDVVPLAKREVACLRRTRLWSLCPR